MNHRPYIMTYASPVGILTIASDGEAITGLWLENQKYFGSTLPGDVQAANLAVFDQARDWLDAYFAGRRPDCIPPLAPRGSPFRQAVWNMLCRIPYGEVTTYGKIAGQLAGQSGNRVSPQAVGGAVGHNPISILIPCHRVVGTNGSLTGYAGGISKKIWLLKREGVSMDRFFVPTRGTAL